MKVGDLVKYKVQDDNGTDEQTGVVTSLRRNSMNSSDKYTTYYVYWSHLCETRWSDYAVLEVINASG